MEQKIKELWSKKATNKDLFTRLLYIVTAIVVFFWFSYGITILWNHNLGNEVAANRAYLVEINGNIQNLPAPSQIQIGKTSGIVDELVYKYQSVVDSTDSPAISNGSIFSLGPNYFKINDQNNRAVKDVLQISDGLKRITNLLKVTKKFLQYNPQIDLEPVVNSQETDSSERANRTADGIETTVEQLSKIDHENAGAISATLKPLVEQARKLTATNAPEWYKTVETAQQRVITILDDEFDKQTNSSKQKLADLSQKYLDLKPANNVAR